MIRGSIRNKLILFLLVATILPISTSIWITYFFTKSNITDETVQHNSNLIYQGKANLENYLNILNQTSLTVYNDIDFYRAIENKTRSYIESNEIVRGVQRISGSLREIHQVYLYVNGTNSAYSSVQRIPLRSEGPEPKYKPTVAKSEVRLESTHTSHGYGMSGWYTPTASVITLHRSVTSALSMEEVATLSIDVSLDVISSIGEQLYAQGEEEFFILDQQGQVVYSSESALMGTNLTDQWVQHLLSLGNAKGSFEWNNHEFKGIHIYERMETPYMNWTIVKRIPFDTLYQNARRMTEINTLILLFFLIVVIVATLYISFRFTAPIKQLLRYINQIQSGNMQVDIHPMSNDELGILARRFRLMMQRINSLIMEEYRLELANKTNQLKALQAQINPHFLYNSLQSIGTLALQHNAPKVYTLLSTLAKMMRYSMNTSETMVPLRSELEHVKAYLQLQLQRFEDELDVVYELDPSVDLLPVPKMILQPIVENYFKHGFDPSLGRGRIRIVTRNIEEEELLHIIIEDNGKGLSEEEMSTLQQRLIRLEDVEQEDSIGLLNVMLRLQLYYNNEVKVKLTKNEPAGLRVLLLIPSQQT
jgi:two-component system, sensor histidine kinase YesM